MEHGETEHGKVAKEVEPAVGGGEARDGGGEGAGGGTGKILVIREEGIVVTVEGAEGGEADDTVSAD